MTRCIATLQHNGTRGDATQYQNNQYNINELTRCKRQTLCWVSECSHNAECHYAECRAGETIFKSLMNFSQDEETLKANQLPDKDNCNIFQTF